MAFICVICMVTNPPLMRLNGEARRILEAIVTPVVSLHPLRQEPLLSCASCMQLLRTVFAVQSTAVLGVQYRLSLLALQQQTVASALGGPAASAPPGAPQPVIVNVCSQRQMPAAVASSGTQAPLQNHSAPAPIGSTSTLPYPTLLEGPPDPLLLPIKTENKDDIKVEVECQSAPEQLTHAVDIKSEAALPARHAAPSPVYTSTGALDTSPSHCAPLDTTSGHCPPAPASHLANIAPDTCQVQAPQLATLAPRDEPTIATFTHQTAPRGARVAYAADNVYMTQEVPLTLPKMPKLVPRPPPAARAAAGGKPPASISKLQSSVKAMEKKMSSFSRGVADVARHAPSSAVPQGTAPEQGDQPADDQSPSAAPRRWFVRVLSGAEVLAARSAARAAPEFAAAAHRCHMCLVAFRCATGKAMHDRIAHPFADGRYECQTCGHREGELEACREHARGHATRYCCCYCEYTTADLPTIKQHYCEPKLRQWESSNVVKDLFKGKKKRKPLPVKCKVCNARFTTEESLKAHQERKHSEPEVPQTCQFCKKQFKNKYRLYHHEYSHKKKMEYSEESAGKWRADLYCVPCGYGFSTPAALRLHQASLKHRGSRDLWTHECHDCGRKFSTKTEVRKHILATHLKPMNLKCAQCPRRFSVKCELRRHERAHGPRKRPYVCHECGKNFTVQKSLTDHLLAHAGLRPYACPRCPATFSYSAALYTHNRLKHLHHKRTWPKKHKAHKAPKDGTGATKTNAKRDAKRPKPSTNSKKQTET